ncbi:MAG: phage baseplate assembly protein V, partial [Pseudoxanthomonas sp.]
LDNDPESEGRIQVRLPMLGDNASPLWARLLCFEAGQDRGASFVPEIGDEVLLGFAGDASQPVVLGALHSSAHPSPLALSDGNHQKGYVSRSGLQLRFDDARKSIALSTPAGNQLVLSEDEEGIRLQDSHGNRIVMDAAGIRIESAAKLLLQAANDARVEAVNLRLQAASQLDAEGMAGASLEAGGLVKLRGSIVQIN